jgi:hypothetical protein
MKTKRLYKINSSYTCVSSVKNSDEYTEKKGYYKSKLKATYIMLMNRLEYESDSFRQKKIKIKINKILDESPEVAI